MLNYVGVTLEEITAGMGAFWHHMVAGDSQLRWIGPEKGAIHLATAAIVNSAWDLWPKSKGKPVWKLLVHMSPKEVVGCLNFSYVTDAITPVPGEFAPRPGLCPKGTTGLSPGFNPADMCQWSEPP